MEEFMAAGMTKGQRFVCQNPECRCELEVTKAPFANSSSNPEMKKPYIKPSVTTQLAKAKSSHA
jgi:hypothetical protein